MGIYRESDASSGGREQQKSHIVSDSSWLWFPAQVLQVQPELTQWTTEGQTSVSSWSKDMGVWWGMGQYSMQLNQIQVEMWWMMGK